mgnify:CR=1 FL=1
MAPVIPLFVAYQTATSAGPIVYYDPFSLVIFMLILMVIAAVAAYVFSVINDIRNNNRTTDAQVMTLNSQTNNMNNLVQAVVTALNVNTAMYQREVEHNIEAENRILRLAELYANANIGFMQNLQNLLMLQTTVNDVRQLQTDRIKAHVVAKSLEPEVVIEEYVGKPQVQPQPQQQQK